MTLGWLSFERGLATRPAGCLGCASGLGGLSGAALRGDPGRGERGSTDQAVVLNDRFDCRSRHAAHGSRDARANSLLTRENLALSCESIGGGESAPEAGPRRQSRGIGGGRCLRMWAEDVSMEGAPGPGKPLSLTRGREKRSSALHKYPVYRRFYGGRQERQRFAHPLRRG
jgi:hypothetical protein